MLLDKPRDYVDEICEHMPAYSGEMSQVPEIDGADYLRTLGLVAVNQDFRPSRFRLDQGTSR